MSNMQDPELKMTLEKVKLGQYYSKFLEVQLLFCDLEEITDDELKLVIPLSFHRKRLLKFLKAQKEVPANVPNLEVGKVEGRKSVGEDSKMEKTAFEFEKYLIQTSSLEIKKKLGRGSFGDVYKGVWKGKGGGIDVAFKLIDLNRRFQPQRHLNEFRLMLKTHYPLVLQVFGYAVSEDQNTLYIVMELMDEDLLRYLFRKKLTLVEKVSLMIRMAQCLHHLHSCEPRIIHRDVKSVNFLLSNEGKLLKICDFGIAKSKLSTVATSSEGGKGTTLWMSPELFKSGAYTKKSDVYALAMTFFEVLNEEMPFFQEIEKEQVRCNAVSVYDFIKDGKRPMCKKEVPQDLVAFLGLCWCNDPSERLSTSEIIEWLTEYKQKLLSPSVRKPKMNNTVLLTNQERVPSRDPRLEKMVGEGARKRESNKTKKLEEKNVVEIEVGGKKRKTLKESKATKTKKLEEKKVVKEKKEMEMEPSSVTVPRGFKSQRGILVPQNVVFEVNEKYRSYLEKMFSNGNKVAKGIHGYSCFKTSAVFTAGKKFYFQVSANIRDGYEMGFGILSGEVTANNVGKHGNGWSYHCYPGGTPKRTYHNSQVSFLYGPERTLGKHTFGIFCDFTNGKGEVSFIVDGKNWGVAYDNVEPPVSPAFYILRKEDSFKIEDSFEVPGCV